MGTITRSQAEQLLQALLEVYSDEAFQNKVHTAARAVMYEHAPFLSRLRPLALNVQIGILRKWGFDDTEEEMRSFGSLLTKPPKCCMVERMVCWICSNFK